ncbi:MAG TPA: prephenate dehydratase [Peptococcaceae bacterium]|nr:MAG: Prephenate dehydratase [Moorella sp. 60_41]HBT46418.1 prephenate dehydratase [Peptococcaceae bacterium]
MKTVAYLGPEGTFSHQAALAWGGRVGAVAFRPADSLPEVIQAVHRGEGEAAVLPLENSIEGSVNLTLDLLLEEPELRIIGEVVLEVHHCLATRARQLDRIEEVWSHPHALAQCRRFLAEKLPRVPLRTVNSTAEAMRMAADREERAAVGSLFAAALYRVPVLYRAIEDHPGNKTRFVVIGREALHGDGPYKTSLVLAVPENRPGGLYEVLRYFAEAGINLTRIESRPTKKELGEYLFFLDCEGHAQLEPLSGVLAELKPRTALLKILGSYPCHDEVEGL